MHRFWSNKSSVCCTCSQQSHWLVSFSIRYNTYRAMSLGNAMCSILQCKLNSLCSTFRLYSNQLTLYIIHFSNFPFVFARVFHRQNWRSLFKSSTTQSVYVLHSFNIIPISFSPTWAQIFYSITRICQNINFAWPMTKVIKLDYLWRCWKSVWETGFTEFRSFFRRFVWF